MEIKKPLVINQSKIGEFTRELRLMTGLTQEQFAATVGVTFSTVNRWENGRAMPSPMAMKLIENILRSLLADATASSLSETKQIKLAKYLDN